MEKEIPKYKFNYPENESFEITSLSNIYEKSKQQLGAPHRQDFYGLFYFTNTAGKHVVDFNEYRINKGDIFFISNEQVHYFKDIQNSRGTVILFTALFLDNEYLLDQVFETAINNPFLSISTSLRKYFDTLIKQMQSVFMSNRKMKYDILKNYLEIFLYEIDQFNQESSLIKNINYQRFIRFKKDLKAHFRQHVNVGFYAEEQNISAKTLNLAIREVVDKSAKHYISEYLILLAKRMLVNSSLTSSEIAYKLGFDEPTNFNKFFKKHEQVSPRMFRKGC